MRVAVAVLLLAAGCSRQAPQQRETGPAPEPKATSSVELPEASLSGIATEQVKSDALASTVRATGRIAYNTNQSWRVGAITEGRVVAVYGKPGDKVEKGHVLARLHSHEVHEARADFRKAKGELTRLQASEGYHKQVRDRALRLLELRAGSKAQVEQSDADLKNAAAAVAGAEIELERVRTHLVDFLGVSAEEPGHHQPGEHPGDEDLIPIRAPAAGLILELYVTAGSVVSTSDPIMLIGDLSVVWMLAQVPEEHLASTRVGGSASVMVKAYPHRRFIGRIGRIDPQLDPETRTVQARIDLDNRDGLLKPEMFAAAEMPVAGVRHVLHIPEESIQEVKGQTVVFLKRQARSFEAVAVDTGVSAGGRVEVTGGLKPGDLVVTRGAFLLKAQLLRGSLAEE